MAVALAIVSSLLMGALILWRLTSESRSTRGAVGSLRARLEDRLNFTERELGDIKDGMQQAKASASATLAAVKPPTPPKPGRGPMGSSPDGSGQWRAVQPEEGGGE